MGAPGSKEEKPNDESNLSPITAGRNIPGATPTNNNSN